MAGFDIEYDHQIVLHGNDLMHLYDQAGAVLVTATRTEDGWTVTSPSTEDEHVADRAAAAHAMWFGTDGTDSHAIRHLGPSSDQGHGYVTFIPDGLITNPVYTLA